jgi:hypothetical protein
VAGESTFEIVSQRGGSVEGVAVVDAVAYVGLGPRLVALDMSDPDTPRPIAQSGVLPGLVAAVLVQNGVAYVGAGRYVVTLDVSSAGEIITLGTVELSGAISHIVLHGGLLYAAGAIYEGDFAYSGFVGMVDVGRPDRLTALSWVGTPERVASLALSGDVLFIGQHGVRQGIYALDVADPTQPGHPVSVSTLVDPYSLCVFGARLYVGGFMGMHAFDITDPHNPQSVWDLKWTEAHPLGMVDGFVVHEGRIYAAGRQPADSVVPFREVLEPPDPITGQAGAPVSTIVAVVGERLFVTGVASGALEIYDISAPESPSPLSAYGPPLGPVGKMAVSDSVVYLVGQTFQTNDTMAYLHTLQLPDLDLLGEFTARLAEERQDWFSGLTVATERAYLAARDGLWVLNVSDPAAPSLLGKPEIEGYLGPVSAAVVVVDRIVYLALSPADLLLAVDLADVNNPRLIASLQRLKGSTIRGLAVDGELLYAITEGEETDWFHIVGLSGGEMILRSSVQFPGRIYGLAARGGHAVLVGTEGLRLISAVDPEQPQVLAEIPLPGDGHDVAIEGDLAFVTAGSLFSTAQLLAFDVSDPADPQLVSKLDIAGLGNIAVSGEYVVVAGDSMGVYTLAYLYYGQGG